MASAQNPSDHKTNATGCLVRLIWMMLANVMLLFGALLIVEGRSAAFTVFDLLFAAGLFAALLSRYLDIQYFNGSAGTGEPATMRDWRRYAITMAVSATLVWCGAHGLAWYLAK